VLFTSGSTGRPKGVEISHGALAHFAVATCQRVGLSEGDAIVAVTSPSFDIAVLELLLPLTVGARTILASERQCADGRALATVLETARPTLFQATPATYRLLLRAGWRGHAGLRLLCGGETLDSALAAELLPCGAALWNLYGPTETTVWSSAQRVTAAEPRIPIGEPLGDTLLVVLDARLEPVPPGIPGELCIGGAGLARGYRGRPELTAERFVEWVTPEGEPKRLYRTGDLARLRPEGPIELLGRADAQIKLRGHRIELGEIESVLRGQEGVSDAAVLLVDEGSLNARLVAFVVGRIGRDGLDVTRLRAALARQLPAPMLPAAVMLLPTLPLTRHGKLDRNALLLCAAPERAAPIGESTSEVPESPLERTLLAHMRAILGEPSLGRHESFFERGGHSLLAMELFVRLELALGRTLPLAALFEAPSAAGLARVLAEPSREVVDAEIVVIEPGEPDSPAFFCVHGALGGVLGYRTLARHVGAGRRFCGIQADLFGLRPGAASTLEALAAEYVALVRRAQPEGPYYVGGYSFGGLVAFEMARQLRAAGAEVGLVALLDTAAPRAGARASGRERLRSLLGRRRPRPLIARGAEALEILARGASGRLVGLGRLLSFALRAPPEERRPLRELAERRDRAMARAGELHQGYTVAPYAGRVVLFRAQDDSDGEGLDDLGWRPLAPDLGVVVIPGRHQSLLESPQVEALGRALGEVLFALAPRPPR
jgi:thioesterase domain-containing protein